jgi:hypothetical protein
MPGIVSPDVTDPGLLENGLPGPPVLGAVDGTAMLRSEDQIVILPGISRPEPLGRLSLAMLLEKRQERGAGTGA